MAARLALRNQSARTPLGFALVAVLFYVIDGLIVHSSVFPRNPDLLSAAVSFDLTIGVTAAYWLMVVKPGHAVRRTALPIFVASIAAAAVTLPAGHRDLLRDLQYLSIPFELAVIGLVVAGVRATNRRLAAAGTELDVPERIRTALSGSVASRVADVVAMECSILFYAFASWRRQPFVPRGAEGYSYHRKNGYAGILYALVGVVMVETFVLDLVVRIRHPFAANVLLAFDVFGVVWLFGFARAVQLRPIVLTRDLLQLRMGLQWAVDVARENIATIEYGRISQPPKGTPGYVRIGSSPNAMITLREPVLAHGPYGFARSVQLIGVHVDDVREFEQSMRE
jgi:hypothetical protein